MKEYRDRQRFHILASILTGLFMGGLVQYLAFAARRLGASVTMVAMLTALPRVVLLTSFLYAHWFEHLPSTLRTGLPRIAGCLVLACLAFTADPFWFIVIGILGNVGLLVAHMHYGNLVDDLYPATHRGRFLSSTLAAGLLATMAANFAAGSLLDCDPASYRVVFVVCAALGAGGGIVFALIPIARKARSQPVVDFHELALAFRDRKFLRWMVLYSLTTLPFWIAVPAYPVFFNDELGLDYGRFGLTQIVLNGCMLATFLAAGHALDRWGSIVLMGLAWLGVAAGEITLGLCHNLGTALAAQAVGGVALALNDLAWFPVVLEFAPREKVNRYMGVHMTFFGVRSLVGAWLAAVLMQHLPGGSRTALILAGLLTLPGALAILLLRRRLAR